MTQRHTDGQSTKPADASGKDVHSDHVGRDEHGNVADPNLKKNDARAASRNFGSQVLGKSMWLILILMPIVVIIAYFIMR